LKHVIYLNRFVILQSWWWITYKLKKSVTDSKLHDKHLVEMYLD